jgi:hypothetical protein
MLRDRRVTTVVENGSTCYSACAIRFGGRGFNSG